MWNITSSEHAHVRKRDLDFIHLLYMVHLQACHVDLCSSVQGMLTVILVLVTRKTKDGEEVQCLKERIIIWTHMAGENDIFLTFLQGSFVFIGNLVLSLGTRNSTTFSQNIIMQWPYTNM
jgi:hypothetical protein